MNRIYFLYNHFEDALTADVPSAAVGLDRRSFAVDRYTVGFEKILLDDLLSLEVRLPVAGKFDFNTPNFGVSGGVAGNLALSIKTLLYTEENLSTVAGLGLDLPTGSDVSGQVNQVVYTVHNEAVHLSPYLGFLTTTSDQTWFMHGFAQLDVAANGNSIEVANGFFPNAPPNGVPGGRLNEQTLLHLDWSMGRWLYQNDGGAGLVGVALLGELHYTSALQDTDTVLAISPQTHDFLEFTNLANRVDVVNVTTGLHTQFSDRTNVRVAGSFPLRSGDNRLFSSELQVSVNHAF